MEIDALPCTPCSGLVICLVTTLIHFGTKLGDSLAQRACDGWNDESQRLSWQNKHRQLQNVNLELFMDITFLGETRLRFALLG